MNKPTPVVGARLCITALILLSCCVSSPWALGQDSSPGGDAQEQQLDRQLQALHWQKGPKTVQIAGNSTLQLPEGYAFLDKDDTARFEELTHNLPGTNEVMVTPASQEWAAYIDFSDEGLVKDNEKIDADALLAAMRRNNDAANEERRRRGWQTVQIVGWALPPAYNSTTKRLEWATLLERNGSRNVNFSTKILGRHGYTSVILACAVEERPAAVAQLNTLLAGYSFDNGERYADWRPGDKVAAYGLGALVLGGAAAAAAKTGLLKGLLVALAAAWKLVVTGVIAALAFLRSLFTRKKPSQTPETPQNPFS